MSLGRCAVAIAARTRRSIRRSPSDGVTGRGDGGCEGGVVPEALMQGLRQRLPIIETAPAGARQGSSARRQARGDGTGHFEQCAPESAGKRNCELFQPLFRSSVNHNETETS